MPFQAGFNTTPEEDEAWEYYWISVCKHKNTDSCINCGFNRCEFKKGGEKNG